jgi:hypothetical protein
MTMAKGRIITDSVRQIIAETYLAHRDWRAKEVQKEVNTLCHGSGPGLSSIQKELIRIRSRYQEIAETNQEEAIWSIYSYTYFEIPPGALPVVLQAWLFSRSEEKIILTNREVKWIVRLFMVIKDVKLLVARAREYANRELVSGLAQHVAPLAHPMIVGQLVADMTGKSRDEIFELQKEATSPDRQREALTQAQRIKNNLRKS